MVCVGCAERRQKLRDAIMQGKVAEALDITLEGLRVMIAVVADADHRKDADKSEEAAPAKAPAKAK